MPETPETTPSVGLPSTTPAQPSNALAIWALVMGLVCCAPVGIILGIIGLNKYQRGTSGWTMSLVALILASIGVIINIALYIKNPSMYSNL